MKYTSEGRADMIVQKKENAVSPAIATVLLVLMTVLIAAVIAVVVTGMAGDQTNYVVGLTADPAHSGGNVTVTLYGGKDLPNLVKAEVIDAGSAKGEFVEVWKGAAGTALTGVPLVAESVARPEEDRAEYATRIMTKGTFADGTEQVLLERAVTFRGVQSVGQESEEPKEPVIEPPVPDAEDIGTYIDTEHLLENGEKNRNSVFISIKTKKVEGYKITVTDEDGTELGLIKDDSDENVFKIDLGKIDSSKESQKKITISVVKKEDSTSVVTKKYTVTRHGDKVTITPSDT
ncbi:MAG TPA: type IV pilin N-terminal domain-containing protein [Methanocorpusculum sp.]|nr:type IV pilin N-terminal domain-containing protein [Methanocorpusculum sp.]